MTTTKNAAPSLISTNKVFAFLLLTTAMMAAPSESRTLAEAVAETAADGTKWAVLVAGSTGYQNFRHQVSDHMFIDVIAPFTLKLKET